MEEYGVLCKKKSFSHQNFQGSVRYSIGILGTGIGMKACTGILGTGMDVVQYFPKCPVPVLMSYPSYRSVWYYYLCHTEVTAPVLMSYRTYPSVQYRY